MSIVKSFSVGNGDMFYIRHGSDNFTIIDCCLSENNKQDIVNEIKKKSEDKSIIRFISTHPDDDHISGLRYLHEQMNIRNFYCAKNSATKSDQTEDFDQYCELRDDTSIAFYIYRGRTRKWMNVESDARGSAGISVLWPVTNNEHYKEALAEAEAGGSPNNISTIVQYSTGNIQVMWMGDLETDFMKKIQNDIKMDAATILFAPHHGRDSGKVPAKWLGEIDPKIVVIGEAPSQHLNYYAGYNTITQNSAGDIVLNCISDKIHIYVSDPDYSVDFLSNENMPDKYGFYIGTLNV